MSSRYWEKENDIKQRLSERVISYFIGKYVKTRYRLWMLRKESNESRLNAEDLNRICLEHVVPVTSPLALISEIQGSGGTLLSQLLDGHPELHNHPHELMFKSPEKGIWSGIDLSDGPETWFEVLFEDPVQEYNREGYKKRKEDRETFPYVFISSLQREIFLNYIDSIQSKTMRDILNAFMTSYFGAWLNNQNYSGKKIFITAFSSELATKEKNMELFFETYPDGRLISLVRDPKSWFPFVRMHWPKRYADVNLAVDQWNDCALAMLSRQEKYGERVCLIEFEDLLGNTRAVMRCLSEFLGVEFDDILLTPTFNKFPSKANMSFKVKDQVAINSSLQAEKALTEHEADVIAEETSETYSLVRTASIRFE